MLYDLLDSSSLFLSLALSSSLSLTHALSMSFGSGLDGREENLFVAPPPASNFRGVSATQRLLSALCSRSRGMPRGKLDAVPHGWVVLLI